MLQRKIGSLGLFWVALSSMVGSGWLFGALYSARLAGPAALIAWPIAGALMLMVALTYAEIATMFPQAGAIVRLPLYTHGKSTSFMMTWFAWLSLITIPAIEVQALLQYASNYLPWLIQKPPHHIAVAMGLLALFVLLNYFGVAFFSGLNSLFSFWKMLIPVLTILVITHFAFHRSNFQAAQGFSPYGWYGVLHAISAGGVLFSLLGFRQVVTMIGEVRHPTTSLPLVLVSSLLVTIILYTGLQLMFIAALPASALTQGWANLSFAGDAGPFSGLAVLLGVTWLGILLYADAILSPFATGFVYSTTAARMTFTLGQLQHLPSVFGQLNRFDIPWVGLIVNTLFSASVFFLLTGWQAMAAFLVSAILISYAMGPISLVCLRKQLPHRPRPFRLRGGVFLSFLAFFACTLGAYWAGFPSLSKLCGLMILGLVFYLSYHGGYLGQWRHLQFQKSLWIFAYVLGLTLCSYLGHYGGIRFFSEFQEFLLLLLLSLGVFLWAIYVRQATEDIHDDNL